MKRNFELIRDILLKIESLENIHELIGIESFGTYTKEEVFYHFCLLKKAGYIEGDIFYDFDFVANLTWEGHEFLANAKIKKVWEQAKNYIKEKGGSVSLQVLTEILKTLTLQHLGIKN